MRKRSIHPITGEVDTHHYSSQMSTGQVSLSSALKLEDEKDTMLMFFSSDRLYNEILIDTSLRCMTLCLPHCNLYFIICKCT